MPLEPPQTTWDLPDPRRLRPGEVLGVGADLEPGTLLAGYRRGMFPMRLSGTSGPLCWWSPDPRGILPLDGLVVSRSLRRSLRRYEVTIDAAFDDVVEGCADPSRKGAWIDPGLREGYARLHALGWAHSLEVWAGTELVGGLFGVAVGGLFAGESMFHTATDASKVGLVSLVELLRADGLPRLLDVQWRTDHLASLGVIEVSRQEYLERLDVALDLPLPAAFDDGRGSS